MPPFDDLLMYAQQEAIEQTEETDNPALDGAIQEENPMYTMILDAVSGVEKLNLVKEVRGIRETLQSVKSGIEKLGMVKRIKEIRVALGINGVETAEKYPSAEIDRAAIEGYNTAKELGKIPNYVPEWTISDQVLMDAFRAGAKQWLAQQELEVIAPEPVVKPVATIADVSNVMPLLKQFIGTSQLSAMGSGIRGEEGQFFKDKFMEVANVIKTMPKTYDTDGKGDKALAYLHYFKGSADWYITERDMEDEQLQAFGFANLGDLQNAEMGYISIKELIQAGVELDLYWEPKTIGAIKGKAEEGDKKPEITGISDLQKMVDSVVSHGGEVIEKLEYGAVAFALHGGKYYGDQPPLLSTSDGMYRVTYNIDAQPFFTDYYIDPHKAVGAYVDIVDEKMREQSNATETEQNPMKSAFEAELNALKSETDIETFDRKLDEIAGRIEAAGLMEEMDENLNEVADVLTELLAEAEKPMVQNG